MRILRSFGTTTTSTPLSLSRWPSFQAAKTREAYSSMPSGAMFGDRPIEADR